MAQPPKFRILSPESALRRARPDPSSTPSQSQAPSQSPTTSHSPATTTTATSTSTPKSTPNPRFSFSPFSRLRNYYATLPRPFRLAFRTIGAVAPIVPIGLYFSEYVGQLLLVNGPSMTPYLNEDYDTMHTKKDIVLVKMWPGLSAFRWGQRNMRIERGMLVLFPSPGNPDNIAIKRVIGLPGDRITTREPCAKPSQIVPFNHVWLEGDNPKKSLDSNTYGPVSISLISGRVMAVVWPRFRWLSWEEWESGDVDGGRFGEGYLAEVRERVEKGAVELQKPFLI
ncbi:hypothetical protein BDW72DRAFT_177019 [Aspergillus terricola var. indicus]